MIKVQYRSKWCNPIYQKVTNNKKSLKPILSLVFVVVVSVLLPSCCHIGWGVPYMCIFVEEVITLLGAITDKWL